MRHLIISAAFLSITITAARAATPPRFTSQPTARRDGNVTRIDFSVDRPTDVAVFIEDGGGRVVRHLVAGVLGENAPPPLKSGLAQSVTWDGKADWGKPAGGGPFRVRVALGLGARFDKVLAEEKQNFGYRIKGLVADGKGELYVLSAIGANVPNWFSEQMVAVDREGKYLRTIMPFPASIDKNKLGSVPSIELDGKLSPLVHNIASRSFYPGRWPGKVGLGLTGDGVVVMAAGGHWGAYGIFVNAVKTDGSVPWGDFNGPEMTGKRNPDLTRASVCVSGDGKWGYLSGYEKTPAVMRVPLPGRDKVEIFFGDPAAAGKDDSHLGAPPKGLALDGQGNLAVADPGNNRVLLVSEKTGKVTGQFAFESPDCVAVDPGTGAFYLTRAHKNGAVDLVKVRSAKDPTPVANMPFKPEADSRSPWVMTLDTGAKPPIVWMGGDGGSLIRLTEDGGKFTSVRVNTKNFGRAAFVDLQVDRWRADPEVYTRTAQSSWVRFSEKTGNFEPIKVGIQGKGLCILPGPDGNIYGTEWPAGLYKWSRDGKPIPWENPEPGVKMASNYQYRPSPHGAFVPVCMGFMMHAHGIRHDGHHFVFSRHPDGPERGIKALHEYDTTGKRIRGPIIWKASDAVLGPKFDQEGNIYVADQIKPAGEFCPKEFNGLIGDLKLDTKYPKNAGKPSGAILAMYGSIMKFSDKGGMIEHYPANVDSKNVPFVGEPKLDPALKTEKATWYHSYDWVRPAEVTGALWTKLAISHVPLFYCNCETTRFDVDEFGRVWYPDLGRFRVCVLDTNGNGIMEFGRYGNADFPTQEGGKDIPFAWLIGVGVTDNYIYTGDSINKRLQRAKVLYAAEATAEIK